MELICPFTGNKDFERIFIYKKAPKGEINLKIQNYYREIWQNRISKHYLSIHNLDLTDLYEQQYVNATYNDDKGILDTFNRIISLPKSKSDNKNRVKKVNDFVKSYSDDQITGKKLLDIGSGLAVFPYEMKKKGWDATALDPDIRAVEHAINTGLNAIKANFFHFKSEQKYHLITFNKVLEHVEDPIEMLKKCINLMNEKGLIYIEVPDGEMASNDVAGKNREEFFIDHLHVFSISSLSMMISKAGFTALQIERLQEPSSKYTLRAFITIYK